MDTQTLSRIHIDKSNHEFVIKMCRTAGNNQSAPFDKVVDLMAFAASYAASKGEFMDKINRAPAPPDPVRQEVIKSQNYGSLFQILAAHYKEDILALDDSIDSDNQKAVIFEGYANKGMSLLQDELQSYGTMQSGIEVIIQEQLNAVSQNPELTLAQE